MNKIFIPDIIRCVATYLDVKDVVEYICINKNINKAILCDSFAVPYYNLHLSEVNNRYPRDKKVLQILMMKYKPDINTADLIINMFESGYLIAAKNYIKDFKPKKDKRYPLVEEQYSQFQEMIDIVNNMMKTFNIIPEDSRKFLWDIGMRHAIKYKYDDCFDYCISMWKPTFNYLNLAIICKNMYVTKYVYNFEIPINFCTATRGISLNLDDNYSAEFCILTHNYLNFYEDIHGGKSSGSFLSDMIHLIIKLQLPYDVNYISELAAKRSSLECNQLLSQIHNFTEEQYKSLFLAALKHNDISVIDFYYCKIPSLRNKMPTSENPGLGEFIFFSRLGIKFPEENLTISTVEYILQHRKNYTHYDITLLLPRYIVMGGNNMEGIIEEDYPIIMKMLCDSSDNDVSTSIRLVGKAKNTAINDKLFSLETLKHLIEKKKHHQVRHFSFLLSNSTQDDKVISYCKANLMEEETAYVIKLLQDTECSFIRHLVTMQQDLDKHHVPC